MRRLLLRRRRREGRAGLVAFLCVYFQGVSAAFFGCFVGFSIAADVAETSHAFFGPGSERGAVVVHGGTHVAHQFAPSGVLPPAFASLRATRRGGRLCSSAAASTGRAQRCRPLWVSVARAGSRKR